MAWQVSRVSSELCKRFKPSLKHLRQPSTLTRSSHGDLESSVSRIDIPHHCKSISSFSSLTDSFRVSNTNSSRTTDSTNFCTNPAWICRGLASRYHANTSHEFTSISTKPFSSASRSSTHRLEGIQDVENGGGERVDADILHTEDGQVLYSGMKSAELLSTLLNLHLVAYEPLVDLSIKVLKSPLMSYAAISQPLLAMVKRTAFSHFCAGDGVAEASKTLQRMWELGLKSILDYSLEDAMDNSTCDRNLMGFMQTVQQTKQLPSGSVSSFP